ncbi:MAG: thymidine phosphorylase [Chloroflexi bacterium 13_1_40CM_4_68_4]|nr:MAG: thymidine phosphorylase [Chloroflexi bacterium 13_1_40CM_4_68_4]
MFRAVDVIEKKRDGKRLSTEEIAFFVDGFTRGTIADYQMSAFLMAVLLRGMDPRETTDLTMAMVSSGERLDLSEFGRVVDKHSTGGVGDKTTLIVAPLVAACGLPVGKMSGRGLGFSGGTLDKLESIPGYRVQLTTEEFLRQLRHIGIVLAGQTKDLAPADGAMYALRDVTGTVPSIPLIASSVMSKKIAGGAQAVVLDVKVGRGAFMKDLPSARRLARLMVQIGKLASVEVVAELTDMDQPLGRAVGNSLEVAEAIATLRGEGPDDLVALTIAAGAEMLLVGKRARTAAQAKDMIERAIADRSGLGKFRELVDAQGGDVRYVDDPLRLPRARRIREIHAPRAGYVADVAADAIGMASLRLGAGREKKGDPIDHATGAVLHVKVGSRVAKGDVLAEVHLDDRSSDEEGFALVARAFRLSPRRVRPRRLILARVA